MEDEEIDNERGVIHEEWRSGMGAQRRMMIEANKVIYKGSKYADHTVIGDIDIVDNFEYQRIKDFYNDWYRPDLQAVIAIGDFDADMILAKIEDMFGVIPAVEDPRTKELYEVPDHQETYVSVITDPEAQYNMLQVYYKHPANYDRSMHYYRDGVVESLYSSMLNARLQELLLQENPPFIYGAYYYGNIVRTKDAYIGFAVAKENEIERTLETLLIENERVKQYGFTDTEFERAKKDVLSGLEKEYNEREKQESSDYTWVYFGHFVSQEPAPGIEFEYAFVKSIIDGIALDEVNTLASEWVSDENRVVVVQAPEKEGVTLPSEEEILAVVESIKNKEITAYVDKVSDDPMIADEPVAVAVASKKKNKKLETVNWEFDNGINAVIKPTDFKDDEILMTSYSLGGTSVYDIDELISADVSDDVISMSGLGTFDAIEFEKKMAGKVVSVYPRIGGVSEGISGSCAPKDLETMLQQIYLYFTAPRKDETAYAAYMTRMKGILENKSLNPSSTLRDTLSLTMADYHPRAYVMTSEKLDEANLNDAFYIFQERFGDPGSFTFYFVGNIDPVQVQPMFEKYFGGLHKVMRDESFRDNGVRPPKGKVEKKLYRDMQVPKATVFITYTGVYDFDDFEDRLNLSALCDVLDVRYVETVREEEGGTYGVGVWPRQYKYPYEYYNVNISFDCDPENVDNLKAIIYDEIEKLKTQGPVDKDITGVKENKIKSHQEKMKKNDFWLKTLKNHDFNEIDYSDIFDYEDYVNDISKEELKAAANKFFGENIIEIVLLPNSMENNVKNPGTDKK